MGRTQREKKRDLRELCGKTLDKVDLQEKEVNDKMYDYTAKLVSLGILYMEFCDAIKEGDGERILQCWKFLLPIFKNAGRKSYSFTMAFIYIQSSLTLLGLSSTASLLNSGKPLQIKNLKEMQNFLHQT